MSEIINPRTGERTPVELRIIDPVSREVDAEVYARVEALPDFTVTMDLHVPTDEELAQTFREGGAR